MGYMVRACLECGRSYRPVFVLQRHCTLACEYQMHERERRRRLPESERRSEIVSPPECRALYVRDIGIHEPPWVTEALEPPRLPFED